MLHYASKKHPEEGAYKLYLAEVNTRSTILQKLMCGQLLFQHGGHGNACTSTEHTTFLFAVNQEGFEETLDR